MGILLLTDGRLQADGFLCDAHDLADLSTGMSISLGDLLGGGVVAVLMQQLALDTRHLLMVSTMCTGIRMVRAWSAMARVMA